MSLYVTIQSHMRRDGLDPIFKALADPTRRGLLDLLRDEPRTVGDLAEAFPGLSRYAVMKHLRVLEDAGLGRTRKDGRKRWKHLDPAPLRRMYERWVSPYADLWAASLERVSRLAEEPDERPPTRKDQPR